MNMKRIAVGVAMLLLAVGVVIASAQPHGRRGGEFGGFGMPLQYMTDVLNLTDAQQSQVKSIFEAEKPNFKALRDQQKDFRKQMDAATQGGNFDEAKVRSIAQQQSQTFVEMAVAKARVKSKIWNVLTPEQRQKAEQLKARHEQRMNQWKNNKGEAAPAE
jgi:protein CpxP